MTETYVPDRRKKICSVLCWCSARSEQCKIFSGRSSYFPCLSFEPKASALTTCRSLATGRPSGGISASASTISCFRPGTGNIVSTGWWAPENIMSTGWPSNEGQPVYKKSQLFNSISTNLEYGSNVCWIRLNFWRESLANMQAELIRLCASRFVHSSLSLPRCDWALKTAEERSAWRAAVSSSRILILAQRAPALVAWLRCWSLANIFTNNFPQCGFVHWYPIIRRAGGALNACASIVRENGKTKRFRWPNRFTDHTPHQHLHFKLTVFLKHLRTSPAIPTSIVRRNSGVSVKGLGEHLKRKKMQEPDGVCLPVFEELCTRSTRLRWGAGENRANITLSMSGLVFGLHTF